MSLRHRLGAIVYDWPRFVSHIGGDWKLIRNRAETITSDGRGVRCEWEFTSQLHLANVYPSAARLLMARALGEWPIVLSEEPSARSNDPDLSFVIGHRGLERLPNLLLTLKSIAGQVGVTSECIVVEQSTEPEIEASLPAWVRYLHTPVPPTLDYCRSSTFNAGAGIARGRILVLHDNDMLVPAGYAAELTARIGEGFDFVDLKRFIFYLAELDTHALFGGARLRTNLAASAVVQNLRGGSVAARRAAFFLIGGFDEGFVGWGGEDQDFWDRAACQGSASTYGYLPIVHLWHPAQKDKRQHDAPAVQRYTQLRSVPPEERIRRLRAARELRV